MNINDLTISQAKELTSLFNNKNSNGHGIADSLIGKYVIVRSRNEGVNAGYLEQADNTGCVLLSAKRLYKPISKDRSLSWYEGVSVSGLGDESIVSGAVEKKVIVEDYSAIPCTEIAKNSIKGYKANETTC